MILFATHWSYSLILKPILLMYCWVVSRITMLHAGCCIGPFLVWRIALVCCFFHMNFLYSLGSNLMINFAIVPSSSICMSWSMTAWRKASGISITATCFHSLASIVHDRIIASIETVGELVSFFFLYSCCKCPSAHPLTLMLLSRFLKNIKYRSAFFFSSYDMSFLLTGSSASHWCSLFSSLSNGLFPFSPNHFVPSHMFICVSMMCACGFGIATVADCWLFCSKIYMLPLFTGLGLRLYLLLFATVIHSGLFSIAFSLLCCCWSGWCSFLRLYWCCLWCFSVYSCSLFLSLVRDFYSSILNFWFFFCTYLLVLTFVSFSNSLIPYLYHPPSGKLNLCSE